MAVAVVAVMLGPAQEAVEVLVASRRVADRTPLVALQPGLWRPVVAVAEGLLVPGLATAGPGDSQQAAVVAGMHLTSLAR